MVITHTTGTDIILLLVKSEAIHTIITHTTTPTAIMSPASRQAAATWADGARSAAHAAGQGAGTTLSVKLITKSGSQLSIAVAGPVFSTHPTDGTLHMRYTARKKYVIWRDDAATREALDFLNNLLSEGLYTISHRLAPGEVILCNNVLHARSVFNDDEGGDNKGRLLLRARYRSRIHASGEQT